jgi:hypothetical protein
LELLLKHQQFQNKKRTGKNGEPSKKEVRSEEGSGKMQV